MNVVLGFGDTELENARSIIDQCIALIKEGQPVYRAVESVRLTYNEKKEKNDKLTRTESPQRYTYFYFFYNEIFEGKYNVEFTFHHINRNHPFSPDGWALWVTNWILGFDEDGFRIYKEL